MKKIFSITFLSLAAVFCHADPTLFWGSDTAILGSGTGVIYTNGLAVSQGSDWLVELVNTADDSVLYSTINGFSAGDGLFYSNPDAAAWNGLTVKTVIFDAPTKEAAGLFAEFSTVGYAITWAAGPPPPSLEYNAGFVTSALGTAPGQWQAIPEPAVAVLIGLFGSGLLVSRRIFRKD